MTWGGARKGAGRKPAEDVLSKVAVRLPEKVIAQLRDMAAKRDTTINKLIGAAVTRALTPDLNRSEA